MTDKLNGSFPASFFATCRCHTCWTKASQLAVLSSAAGKKVAQIYWSVSMITLRADTWQFQRCCYGLAAFGPDQKEHACSASIHAAQTGSYSGLFVPDPSDWWMNQMFYQSITSCVWFHMFHFMCLFSCGWWIRCVWRMNQLIGHQPYLIFIDVNQDHAVK